LTKQIERSSCSSTSTSLLFNIKEVIKDRLKMIGFRRKKIAD